MFAPERHDLPELPEKGVDWTRELRRPDPVNDPELSLRGRGEMPVSLTFEYERHGGISREIEALLSRHSQGMGREQWIRELSDADRKALVATVLAVNERVWPYHGYGLTAVGTTTFSDEYWNALREHFTAHAPHLLPFVGRRGEDIDLLLTTSSLHNIAWLGMTEETSRYGLPNWLDLVAAGLHEHGIPFEILPTSRDNGTVYHLTREVEGGELSYSRAKIRELSNPSLVIRYPGARPIHLSYNDSALTNEMLERDIQAGRQFTHLFSAGNRYDFLRAVAAVQAQGELFAERSVSRLDDFRAFEKCVLPPCEAVLASPLRRLDGWKRLPELLKELILDQLAIPEPTGADLSRSLTVDRIAQGYVNRHRACRHLRALRILLARHGLQPHRVTETPRV